jgi:hypothetical protein
MREWALIPRESERCTRGSSRAALGDTGGQQRVGEGDEHSRRLFVADEFARQAGRVQDVHREEDERLVEVEGNASRSTEKTTNKWSKTVDDRLDEKKPTKIVW